MVINNQSTEIGDELIFIANVPIVGLLSLTGFSDDIVGETTNRYFYKEFMYSLDGLNYTTWIPLTTANVQAIQVQPTYFFFVKYKYTRSGSDSTNILELKSITLDGTFQNLPCGSTFNDSVFSQFIDCPDADVLDWCVNVTDKLYKQGIVPNYILRRINQDTIEDEDYIDFWRTVACFFATIVVYGRRLIEQFSTNSILLQNFLQQKGMYLSSNMQFQDMTYLMAKYFDEIRQRGTSQIYKEKQSTQLPLTSIYSSKSVIDKKVDGELLRLIDYQNLDEFIFNFVKKQHVGWNVDNSSPLFQGITCQDSVNKAYEQTQDILTLSPYPLYNSQYISREHDAFENKWVMKIERVPVASKSGVGPILSNLQSTDFNKCIRINEGLDYEITFWLKQPTYDDSDSDSTSDSLSHSYSPDVFDVIAFGCYAFDENNNQINLQDIITGLDRNLFFQSIALTQKNRYYFVRGILYNKNEALKSIVDGGTNLGIGANLRLKTGVKKIIPYIALESSGGNSCLYIRDIKVRPLRTPFSTGFIQTKNFIEIWLQQNNMSLTNVEIEEIMRKYLLPYNCNFKNIYI